LAKALNPNSSVSTHILNTAGENIMGHKKKVSLKASLQSQQIRLKNKQKAAHAIEAAEVKGKRKGKGKALPLRPTIPFMPTDKILLIGEGNFSFAHALVVYPPSSLEHLPPSNITATAYDSEQECYSKYPDAKSNVHILRERGAEVLFGVDATRLEKCSALKARRFNCVVWNFPHAGMHPPLRSKSNEQAEISSRKGYHRPRPKYIV